MQRVGSLSALHRLLLAVWCKLQIGVPAPAFPNHTAPPPRQIAQHARQWARRPAAGSARPRGRQAAALLLPAVAGGLAAGRHRHGAQWRGGRGWAGHWGARQSCSVRHAQHQHAVSEALLAQSTSPVSCMRMRTTCPRLAALGSPLPQGIPSVDRAVINRKENDKDKFHILVEGTNLQARRVAFVSLPGWCKGPALVRAGCGVPLAPSNLVTLGSDPCRPCCPRSRACRRCWARWACGQSTPPPTTSWRCSSSWASVSEGGGHQVGTAVLRDGDLLSQAGGRAAALQHCSRGCHWPCTQLRVLTRMVACLSPPRDQRRRARRLWTRSRPP